ncbi:MAG: hypothetical protein GX661_01745 [Acholeplasmataceae bacterium]|nr:hypothetical protein [Acholeplasmataceae bacterium]
MENINENCKQCGAVTENQYELITLKTMVDRGWRKNKYYQAMGDIVHAAVCDDCLDKYINQVLHPTKRIVKLSLLSALVFGGCVVLFLFVQLTAFRVFCAIIAAITVLAFLQELKNIRKKTNAARKRTEADNHKILAVDLISRYLPKRHEDAELTYLDVRRIKRENLELLGKEYGFSYKKLVAIRNYLREEKRNQRLDEIDD